MQNGALMRGWLTKAIACLMAVTLFASAADAQFGRGMREMTQPDVDSEQIDRIGQMLEFSEDQYAFASELHQTYLTEMAALADEAGAIMDGARDEFRQSRDMGIWEDLQKALEPFGKRKERITERFFSDMRLLLTPEQDGQWDEVERFHRRYTSFSNDALLSGETVDVIEAVYDMELPEEQMETLKPILQQYSITLDRALQSRNKTYEEGLSQGMELWRRGEWDKMQELFEDAKKEAKNIRDINRRFARNVQTVLSEEYASEWSREFKERSFPRVYRPTPTTQALSTALEFEDITPEQFEQIEAIKSEYDKRADALNDEIAAAIEATELDRGIMEMMGRGRRGGDDTDEIRQARSSKRDLNEATMSKLRALLTDEQAARLPEREDNSNWRDRLPDRRGRGGDRGPRSL